MIELVEMEVREELSTYGYDGDEIPVIAGSALCEIENKQPELGRERILELVNAIDNHVPEPERNPDEPFFMPIETVSPKLPEIRFWPVNFRSIKLLVAVQSPLVLSRLVPLKRTTRLMFLDMVARRKRKFQNWISKKYHTFRTITGMETYLKTLENLEPGDNAGILLKGLQRADIRRGN